MDEIVAQIERDIEALERSLRFWEAQPNAAYPRFDIAEHRESIRRSLENNRLALSVLQGRE